MRVSGFGFRVSVWKVRIHGVGFREERVTVERVATVK